MKKGIISSTIAVVIMVLLLIFSVAIVVRGVSSTEEIEVPQPSTVSCQDDCIGNPDGTACIDIFEDGERKIFCGCITREDCISGECEDNKCK